MSNFTSTSSLLPAAFQNVPGGSLQDMTQVQAVIQKPIKFVENIWGQDVRADPRGKNYDVAASFYPKSFGRERMNTGALPYSGGPRMRKKNPERLTPESTKLNYSRSCFNECLNASGPNYYRWWQIFDYAPFVPSNGNLAIDPRRTAMDTKKFTEPYKLSRGHAPVLKSEVPPLFKKPFA